MQKDNKKEKQKEKPNFPFENIAVVYGPPPRPSEKESLDKILQIPPMQSNELFPSFPTPLKKKTSTKKDEENPEDKSDVYGPPPRDDLFGD